MRFIRWATGLATVTLTMIMVIDELPSRGTFVSSELCEISKTFSCSAVKSSGLAHVGGVPLSLFGFLFGIGYLFRLLNPTKPTIGFMKVVVILNVIFSIALFIYSAIILHVLCPFCVAYDMLGLILLFLERKNRGEFSWKAFLVWGMAGVTSIGVWSAVSRGVDFKEMGSLREQFLNLPEVPQPDRKNGFLLHGDPSKKHAIELSVFSDYECPHCQGLNSDLSELLKEFPEKILIYEYFYPQDSSCNEYVRSLAHPHSCRAAMLAACAEDVFPKVHDELFLHQKKLSDSFIETLARKHSVSECLGKKRSLRSVKASLTEGQRLQIRMNPTIIVNGRKLEGRPSRETLREIFNLL